MSDDPEKSSSELVKGTGQQVINISGDAVTQGTADYPPEHRAAVRWIYEWAKDSDWSWRDLEKNLKISTTTWYRVWSGKYRNPDTGELIALDNLVEKIQRYRAIAEERALARRMPFIETSVWRRVDKICSEALIMQTIAFIYGESQIGKTECLKEHQRRNNHGQTIYVLMPASAGVQSMLKAIATACHISDRTSFESLRERVSRYLDTTKLIIIDEVHEAFVSYHKQSMAKCFSVLRQLQETTGCGMVLCGTNVFRTELEKGEFSQSLKQMRKRGIWELQLESVPSPADLLAISRFYKLPAPQDEAEEVVKWIARDHGLGKYIKFMSRAAQLAAKRQERFTWEHYIKVVSIATAMKEVS